MYSPGFRSSDGHTSGASTGVWVGDVGSPRAQRPTCCLGKELSGGCGETAAEEIELWDHMTCVHHATAWDEQRAEKPRADLGTEEAMLETTGRVVQAM